MMKLVLFFWQEQCVTFSLYGHRWGRNFAKWRWINPSMNKCRIKWHRFWIKVYGWSFIRFFKNREIVAFPDKLCAINHCYKSNVIRYILGFIRYIARQFLFSNYSFLPDMTAVTIRPKPNPASREPTKSKADWCRKKIRSPVRLKILRRSPNCFYLHFYLPFTAPSDIFIECTVWFWSHEGTNPSENGGSILSFQEKSLNIKGKHNL